MQLDRTNIFKIIFFFKRKLEYPKITPFFFFFFFSWIHRGHFNKDGDFGWCQIGDNWTAGNF